VKKISVLIFAVLLVQVVSRYHLNGWVTDHFYWVPFILRFVVPVLLVQLYFHFSWRDLGLGFPQMTRAAWVWILVALVLIPLVVSTVRWSESYIGAYPQYVDDSISVYDRLQRFGLFTLSTFFAWAFLHRAFLLGGLRLLLLSEAKMKERMATGIAILWTMTFEVVYHLLKPEQEAMGLLLFSPLLSYVAVRTRSIWVPTLLHLYLEACFILTLIFLV